jgi:hypothetical protein
MPPRHTTVRPIPATCGRALNPDTDRDAATAVARQLAITGVVTVLLLGILLGLIGWAGRYLFRRRRHAGCDRTWRAVEPQRTRPR